MEYVTNPENGLNREKSIGNIRLGIQYKPHMFMILQNNRGDISDEKYEQDMETFSGLEHFTMKLGVADGTRNIVDYGISDMEGMQERLEYLSFGMQNDIRMTVGTDTLPCVLYHFERSYDLTPHRNFVLGFEDRNLEGDRIIIWDSPEFGTGPVRIAFGAEDIRAIPQLKR